MPGQRRPATMRDVAQFAGVSVRTVSNVVNDQPYVRDETRRAVKDAIAALGYRPNLIARNLRRGSTNTLALVLPRLTQPYFAELADDLLTAARDRGYAVLIDPTDESDTRSVQDVFAQLAMITDGILVDPTHLAGRVDLTSLPVPVVALTSHSGRHGEPVDRVAMDDAGGARLATAHLLESGRTQIAAVGLPPAAVTGPTGRLRLAGYLEAHREAGIDVSPRRLLAANGWDPSEGYRVMSETLDAGIPVDGVFAFNDYMAMGVIHAISAHGLRVPEDIAVVGFDDIGFSQHTSPPLTTVSPGRRRIVEAALDMLLGRIDGTRTGATEVAVVEAELVLRGSSVTKADPEA
ncbi:LacI family DNA-binding transcriptional regulator [Demequina salsinemoris]|uniref:LacI family DNA-binding transcriptional regulator n=1 Tax=Demequina salsinemoris TaxID=577470 RepID=UPI000A0602E2|nr:LacI family DNA-binding transcriptional regulator [Demequina salsinemoris]